MRDVTGPATRSIASPSVRMCHYQYMAPSDRLRARHLLNLGASLQHSCCMPKQPSRIAIFYAHVVQKQTLQKASYMFKSLQDFQRAWSIISGLASTWTELNWRNTRCLGKQLNLKNPYIGKQQILQWMIPKSSVCLRNNDSSISWSIARHAVSCSQHNLKAQENCLKAHPTSTILIMPGSLPAFAPVDLKNQDSLVKKHPLNQRCLTTQTQGWRKEP